MSTLLARPEIRTMKPYESARSLTTSGKVFLDANESPESPIGLSNANRYPEPQPKALVERLCGLYGVNAQELMVGRGSDEAIDLIVRVFCEAGKDKILICPPTYGMYEISAKIQNAAIVSVPMILDPIQSRLDEEAVIQAIQQGIKVVFLCSPNNPTGTPFPRESLSRICEAAIGKSIVVVDEAYAEFAEDQSMIGKINQFPNLIVLRTLSKAWAIAGIRCGVAIAQAPITELIQKVRAPYPLAVPAVLSVLEATDEKHQALLKARVVKNRSERVRMVSELKKFKSVKSIYASATNFLLICFEDPRAILDRAKAKGVILRDRSNVAGLEGCIRITLGSSEENNQVLQLIQEAV